MMDDENSRSGGLNVEQLQERITTAGVLYMNGKVFVARRIEGGSIGGLWEFPGGKNRWGETSADTLKREYHEEFGFDIEVGERFHSHDFINKCTLYHLQAYWIACKDTSSPRLSVHTECRWATPDELIALPFAHSDQEILASLLKELPCREGDCLY